MSKKRHSRVIFRITDSPVFSEWCLKFRRPYVWWVLRQNIWLQTDSMKSVLILCCLLILCCACDLSSAILKISLKSCGVFSSLPGWSAQWVCEECMSDVHAQQHKKWGEESWVSRLREQRAKIITWEAMNCGQGIGRNHCCGYDHSTVLLSSCQ